MPIGSVVHGDVQRITVDRGVAFQSGQPVPTFDPQPRTGIDLSGTWRFRGKLRQLRAGVYRWFVWPAFVSGGQTRYGAPLMRGAFTIAARPTAS